jgi:O-antigen ligase
MTRGCEDPAVAPWILRGMASGVIYELGVALHQRYVLHHHQVAGDFAHQNTFGMAVNLVMPMVLALRLSGSGGRLALPTLLAGASCIVLTLSRGAMTMLLVGSFVVFAASTIRKPTRAKLKTAAVSVAVAGAMLSRAWSTIVDRFVNAPKESAEGREQFEEAARLMLAEHPLGIGMNGFSLALGEAGYGARVGVYGYDATGIVHNIYWLTAAEIGYLGFVAFVVLLASPVVLAARGFWWSNDDRRGDVMLGLGVGLLLMDFQGQLEWAFRQTTLSYLFWTIVSIVTALSRQVDPRAHA